MNMTKSIQKAIRITRNIIVVLFWLLFIVFCLIYREHITIDNIVNYTPSNGWVAALVLFALFALKSVTVFIYGGILYAACGIIFPLPTAILVNLIGTIVMTSIPFTIGRFAGRDILTQLTSKHTKLEMLKEIPNNNELFVSFFVRIVGFLPSDLVGMYLGASGISYRKYICGTLIGLLPAVLLFSVMGMSADDPSSPAFIISACAEIGLMIVSVVLFLLWKRRKAKGSSV